MLIQINTNIATAVYDLIQVRNFHGKIGAGAKMPLFLDLIKVPMWILIVKTKIS